MNEELTTNTLTSILCSAKPENLSDYLQENAISLIQKERPFAAFMRKTIHNKGLKQQDVFIRADIPESYGYKLISGEKHTRNRDVILRLLFASSFSLDDIQRSLKLYGMAPLYPKIPRDAVLMIAANKGLTDPYDIDELLTLDLVDELFDLELEELLELDAHPP